MKMYASYWSIAVLGLLLPFVAAVTDSRFRSTGRSAHPDGFDCRSEHDKGLPSGVYSLLILAKPFVAYCKDGWIVIQRRSDGSENFDRTWDDYKNGFGQPNSDYWLGLESLHQLTKNLKWKLKVEMEDQKGHRGIQFYNNFKVGDVGSKYTLTLTEGSAGSAGDSLTPSQNFPDLALPFSKLNLNGMAFSTKNQDNDRYCIGNCAVTQSGQGWWHNECSAGNLNGKNGTTGFAWYTWKNKYFSLAKSSMSIQLDCSKGKDFVPIHGYNVTDTYTNSHPGTFAECRFYCYHLTSCFAFYYNHQARHCTRFEHDVTSTNASFVVAPNNVYYAKYCF